EWTEPKPRKKSYVRRNPRSHAGSTSSPAAAVTRSKWWIRRYAPKRTVSRAHSRPAAYVLGTSWSKLLVPIASTISARECFGTHSEYPRAYDRIAHRIERLLLKLFANVTVP